MKNIVFSVIILVYSIAKNAAFPPVNIAHVFIPPGSIDYFQSCLPYRFAFDLIKQVINNLLEIQSSLIFTRKRSYTQRV